MAVEEALARHGRPETVDTDQGSQFTSIDFTTALKKAEIAVSMEGKGAWRDNVFAERLDTDDGGTIIQAEIHLARRRNCSDKLSHLCYSSNLCPVSSSNR